MKEKWLVISGLPTVIRGCLVSLGRYQLSTSHYLIVCSGSGKLHQLSCGRWLGRVQTAFSLSESRPAAGASVLSRLHRPSAMSAANAGVVEIVQRVVGNVVLQRVVPDHLARPIGQWANLNQVELRVPVHLEHPRTFASLIAANGRNPGIEGRQLSPQRLDLAQIAALVGIARPKPRPMFAFLFFRCEVGVQTLDLDAVLLFDAVHQVVGFGEKKLRVSSEDLHTGIDAPRDIGQHHAFNAHARGQGNIFPIGRECPGQNLFRLPAFGKNLHAFQIGSHSAFSVVSGITAEYWVLNLLSCSVSRLRSAKRTTSPITSNFGASKRGAANRVETVVIWTCSDSLVAPEIMAHGTSGATPEASSRSCRACKSCPGI